MKKRLAACVLLAGVSWLQPTSATAHCGGSPPPTHRVGDFTISSSTVAAHSDSTELEGSCGHRPVVVMFGEGIPDWRVQWQLKEKHTGKLLGSGAISATAPASSAALPPATVDTLVLSWTVTGEVPVLTVAVATVG